MALIWMDGFDGYGAAADLALRYSRGDATASNIETAGGNWGGGALKLSDYDLNDFKAILPTTIPVSTGTPVHIACWIKASAITGQGVILRLRDTANSQEWSVSGNNSSGLNMRKWNADLNEDVTNGHWFSTGGDPRFVHCEWALKFASSGGYVKLWLDEVLVYSFEGDTGTPPGSVNEVHFGTWTFGSSNNVLFDDFVIWDESGSSFVPTRLYSHRIDSFLPTSDGDLTEFTPLSGANYTNVDETGFHDSDTSYNTGSTGNRDLYKFGSLTEEPATFYGVQISNRAKYATAANDIRCIASLTGTIAEGASKTLGAAYANHAEFMPLAPDSEAWSMSKFNLAQFGIKQQT